MSTLGGIEAPCQPDETGEKHSQEPKDGEKYPRILLCDLNFSRRVEGTPALFHSAVQIIGC